MIARGTKAICDMCGGCLDYANWKALAGPYYRIEVFYCDFHYNQVSESLKNQKWLFNKL